MSKRKLTDICSIQYGCAFDASQFTTLPEEGMPLIRIRDVKDGCTNTYYKGDYSDEYIIHKGDYLVGMDGEFNIEPWQSEDALLNQRVCKIESKSEDVLMRYIYRFLKKELKRIEDDTPFVTVKHLSAKRLNQVLISVPPLPEQEKIVSELDCLSGIIEKKRQQLKELDALAQSIFYEMFGNPLEFVPLSFYIESLSAGKSLASDEECPNKVLKTGAVTYDFFDEKQVKNLPIDYAPQQSHKVKVKDVLISRMNTAELVGACAYVWNVEDSIFLPDRLWRAEIRDNANPIYLWKAITTNKSKEQIRNNASGTSGSMKNISKSSFLKVQIPKVSLLEQQSFAQKIEAIEQQKALIKQSIAEVETLFNARMQEYFE